MEQEEIKNDLRIRQNSHQVKASVGYLFQVEHEAPKLRVFCFLKKELENYEVGFLFSKGMGFHHVKNSLYLGGGVFP